MIDDPKKTPPPPQSPVTKGRRFWKLAGMTASVAGNYAKSRVRSLFQSAENAARGLAETHQLSGQRIADTLGELKGAVMKVGQMASIASDILPKELTGALQKLQKEAPPMPFEVIAEQIEGELGAPPFRLFHSFDEEPFAAASIGQVHRAVTDDGREVVVKVQYPGIDESCDSDLAHLKLALRASGMVHLRQQDLNALFHEIRDRLHEELDYCNEADNVRLFYNYHLDDPTVVIPEVIGERSAQRVLTLSYEPGDPLPAIKQMGYPQTIRDQIGDNFFRLACRHIFQLQAIHADPNPGNFVFRPDGTIVFYDFGCVKKLKPHIVNAYRQTIDSGIREDYHAVEEGLLGLGVRNSQGPPVELDYYKLWRDILLAPFVHDEPFDYAASDLHHQILALVPGVLKRMDSFQLPVELVYLNRMIAGHYGNLRRIGARGRCLQILQEFLPHP